MRDDVTTGPIITVARDETSAASQPADSFNLVACALSAGALTLTLSTIVMFVSLALALAVVSLVLSVLGIATTRQHPWAAWTGALVSAAAVLIGVLPLVN